MRAWGFLSFIPNIYSVAHFYVSAILRGDNEADNVILSVSIVRISIDIYYL